MSRGKYLSLEEARKTGKLDEFCKEHPSTGDKRRFDQLFEAMACRGQQQKAEKRRRTGDKK